MNPMISSDIDIPGPDAESEFDEKQSLEDVADITPDEALSGSTLPDGKSDEDRPSADDHEAMIKRYMTDLPDLEVEAVGWNTWEIQGWNSLGKRENGPTFEVGGFPWRILFFPFGNQSTDHCSFYLEHGFTDKPPEGWYSCVQFMLVLSNVNDPSIYQEHIATHRFSADESDWGFTRFLELRKLLSVKHGPEGRPMLENDSANVTAYVRVIKDPTGVLWHNFVNYDSKKETGMVGLKNQGATCYLNSLLQSLYFTNAFRKAIYQISTAEEADPRENSAYALQRLFYHLQTSESAVPTSELTTSFGWESRQIFEQQDVQELSRILMDKMEERMKGMSIEKALPSLFVGQMKTYIDCINVDYESSRLEDFWDIQLNVRGNATLDDSFKDYIQVETMEGDNKYFAEGHGLQDARKGVIFERFPEVLHLQLKRFEYNFYADAMTKVYDRCEFPEVWDASPYLSDNADKSEPYIYHLHGVLVHSGDLNAGHYYAFLKPEKDGHWYRFDDDRVTRATVKEALDENYGGEFTDGKTGLGAQQRNPYTRQLTKQRYMSAYMLVYIRESRYDKVLSPMTAEDVPPHLESKIKEEKAELERRRKEREEAHLYMNISVGSDKNFSQYSGFDVYPPPLPPNTEVPNQSYPKNYRILRSTTMADFMKTVAEELGTDADLLRPWGLVGRQNNTIRPDLPMPAGDAVTVEKACSQVQAKVPYRIWVESVGRREDGTPDFIETEALTNVKEPNAPILIFLKHFDVHRQTLYGQGHIVVGKQKKVSDITGIIQERMGWSPSTNIKIFEEIKTNMIDPVNMKATFAAAELQHGDVLCFQQVLSENDEQTYREVGKFLNAPEFYQYLLYRVNITFSDRNDIEGATFTLELSKVMTYDQIASKVSDHLKVPATHVRFSTVSTTTGKARQYVKRTQNTTLNTIITPQYAPFGGMSAQRQDWLLYEILDMSLDELDKRRILKVVLLSDGITKEETYDCLVSKSGTVSDLVTSLQSKAKLSDDQVHNLRLYESHTCRVHRELTSHLPVSTFQEWSTIYAEELPEEEKDAMQTDQEEEPRAVYCYHFDKEASKYHGVPFKLVVKPGEPFKDTKERISKRTGIKGKQFEKIRFAVVSRASFHKPEYLEDDDVLADKLVSNEDQLGLDHVNKNRSIAGRAESMMIR